MEPTSWWSFTYLLSSNLNWKLFPRFLSTALPLLNLCCTVATLELSIISVSLPFKYHFTCFKSPLPPRQHFQSPPLHTNSPRLLLSRLKPLCKISSTPFFQHDGPPDETLQNAKVNVLYIHYQYFPLLPPHTFCIESHTGTPKQRSHMSDWPPCNLSIVIWQPFIF